MSQVIPEGWIDTSLGKLSSDISYGYTAKSTPDEVGPQMLRITDIQNNRVNWSSVPYCEIDVDLKAKYLLGKGDLLFARTGATVGKSFLIREDIPESVYASYLIRVRCLPSANINYLSYFFLGPDYWNQITDMSSGIGQPSVNGTKLKGLHLPLPPLAEQKVIADKLDELLSQVESTKARLDAIPAILKSFRQSVLAAAVSGKLTEEWRGENDYSETLLGFDIPKSWAMQTIEDIANVKGGKRLPKGEELQETNTGFKYIRAGQLKHGTIINGANARNKQLYITSNVYEKIKRYTITKGDAYLTIVGASIGDAGVAPSEFDGANLTENAAKICDFKQRTCSSYIGYWLRSQYIQDLIQLEIKSGAQGKLALKRIKTLPFPKVSLKEQEEIVRCVEELFAFADKVEAQVKEAQTRVNKLTQSILAKAFRGEITADWRAANPKLINGENSAAALLERIKAEREAIKKQPKPKRKALNKKTGSKQMIKVIEALKEAGKPLSGQQLLVAAGYPSNSTTEQLEMFFLDIRHALKVDKSIIKVERDNDKQDWFSLADIKEK